jgi:hypothetical protein
MARCWEMRGCDEEMQAECMHSTTFHDRCPTKCAWGFCRLPQNELTTDPALVFATEPDREQGGQGLLSALCPLPHQRPTPLR